MDAQKSVSDRNESRPQSTGKGKLLSWTPDHLFVVFALFFLVLGLVIVKDYGVGWDGIFQYRLGEANYKIYQHPFAPKSETSYGPFSHEYHGPFYQTFAYTIKEITVKVFGEGHNYEAFSFAYYLAFLLGVVCLYLICKRTMGAWWVLAATALYATQPLLFGHAFINPKDTPFLGLMLASVYTGMRMVDQYRAPVPQSLRLQPWLGQRWSECPPARRKRLTIFGLVWLVLVLLVILLHGGIQQATDSLVAALLNSPPGSFWHELAQKVAPNLADIPLRDYQARAAALVFRVIRWLFGVSLVALLWVSASKPAGGRNSLRFIQQVLRRLSNEPIFHLLLAGFTLGLTGATRAMAILAAGGLVAYYFFIRLRWKSLPPLAGYFFTAALTTYAAWPYLWPAPFQRFYNALNTLSSFPWSGTILYRGGYYTPDTLPGDYLPRLMSLQFTEPLVRHFLFITPPLFVFAGLAMEKISRLLKRKWLKATLVVLALLPGVFQGFELHPYQYIYFNSFTGGVSGAFRNYELDYWATSLRESFDYINQNAPSGARVVVWGPENTSRLYAREDLDLIFPDDLPNDVDFSRYDYGVLSSRSNRDLLNVPNAPELFRVQREGATLMVVRRLSAP
jgi:hypothetical protein